MIDVINGALLAVQIMVITILATFHFMKRGTEAVQGHRGKLRLELLTITLLGYNTVQHLILLRSLI